MKNFINRILDMPKLIRTIWFILWIILIILLVMKFCFGIWYPIIIKNNDFININNYIKTTWLKYVVSGIFYFFSLNILYLTSCIKFKYSKWYEIIINNIIISIGFYLKHNYPNFAFIPECFVLIVLPVIYLLKKYNNKKWLLILLPIVIQLLIMIWQLNILFVRGLDNEVINNEYFVLGLVLQFDYYIFIIITWIGVNYMGIWSAWFFSKDITVLKAAREKELARKTPNMETIAKIDKRIAELEKEGK